MAVDVMHKSIRAAVNKAVIYNIYTHMYLPLYYYAHQCKIWQSLANSCFRQVSVGVGVAMLSTSVVTSQSR